MNRYGPPLSFSAKEKVEIQLTIAHALRLKGDAPDLLLFTASEFSSVGTPIFEPVASRVFAGTGAGTGTVRRSAVRFAKQHAAKLKETPRSHEQPLSFIATMEDFPNILSALQREENVSWVSRAFEQEAKRMLRRIVSPPFLKMRSSYGFEIDVKDAPRVIRSVVSEAVGVVVLPFTWLYSGESPHLAVVRLNETTVGGRLAAFLRKHSETLDHEQLVGRREKRLAAPYLRLPYHSLLTRLEQLRKSDIELSNIQTPMGAPAWLGFRTHALRLWSPPSAPGKFHAGRKASGTGKASNL